MKTDLDKQLEEILKNTIPGDHAVYFEAYDEAIAQIKRLFKEDGYKGPDSVIPHVKRSPEELKAISEELSKPRLTGQEWYDRILLEVDTNRYHESDPEYAAQQEVLKAAKKAAGLSNV